MADSTHLPPEVGHAIIALHDPVRGRESAFNQWYEADHMLAAGTMAPWTIGGMRWVATHDLKALRYPSDGPFGPATRGSYLMLFWIQRDRLAEQQAWVTEAMADIAAQDRNFADRDAVTATTYDFVAHVARDPDGVPPVLALAHHFAGAVLLVVERAPDTSIEALGDWLLHTHFAPRLPGSDVALMTAFLLLFILAGMTDINTVTPILVSMIGLGVGIDYSLFIVTRFRQLLHDGLSPADAAAEAGASAGRAVLFAGLTVAISVSGLAFIGLDFVTKLGIGSALGVLTTVLIANSLLIAVLRLLGHKVDRLKVPFLRPVDDSEEAREKTLVAWWGRFVAANAKIVFPVLLIAGLLLALTSGLVRLGAADQGTQPLEQTSRRAYDLLAEGFGAGFNGPIPIVVAGYGPKILKVAGERSDGIISPSNTPPYSIRAFRSGKLAEVGGLAIVGEGTRGQRADFRRIFGINISVSNDRARAVAFARRQIVLIVGNKTFWPVLETLGYDMGLFKDPYQRFGTLDDEMLRAMRLVIDTGIHSKGWTRDQGIKYMLDHSGLGRTDVTAEVERYIAIPSQATAYKVGSLTIQRLREKAKAELGDKFDIREFHAQVLNTGALPLQILEQKIDRWIAAKKAS